MLLGAPEHSGATEFKKHLQRLALEYPDFVIPKHGYLESWARQGVLLLNTVLTVVANEPNSHRHLGWETFTDNVIKAISAKAEPVVFLLWGSHAINKQSSSTRADITC